MQARRVLGDGVVECDANQTPFGIVGADSVGNEKEFVVAVDDGGNKGTDGWYHGRGRRCRSCRRGSSVIRLACVDVVVCKELQAFILGMPGHRQELLIKLRK